MNTHKNKTKTPTSHEVLAHHSMAVVGGFFGTYALLNRSETFGSSETTNLIYLFVSGLSHSWQEFFIRFFAMLVYIGGIVVGTLLGRRCKNGDYRYISIGVSALACIALAQIPQSVDPVLALYPMYFATALQWLAFTSAAGYGCSTIFSTNNVRQCFAGLTEYICGKDPKNFEKFIIYGGTILCFHIGVVWAWFCLHLWELKSIYACLPLIVWGAVATWLDRRGGVDCE